MASSLLPSVLPDGVRVAAVSNDVDSVLAWLRKGRGSDVNARHVNGETLLILAAARGHIEMVEMLLEENAEPNFATAKHANGTRLTALEAAASKGHMVVVELLYGAGARVLHSARDDEVTTPEAHRHQWQRAEGVGGQPREPHGRALRDIAPAALCVVHGQGRSRHRRAHARRV